MPVSVAEFTAEARSWLDSQATLIDPSVWGEGSDNVDLLPRWDLDSEPAKVQEGRDWLRQRQAAGFGGIAFPVSVGGRGLTAAHDIAYQLIEGEYDLPINEIWNIGFGMVMPTVMGAGTQEQQQRFVAPGLRGDLLFCQLFSESEAGSDLGALRTRAMQASDGRWVVRGGKIWTSMARAADFGLLLARTGQDAAPRREAFTVFLVPMRGEGLTIEPVRQITGGSNFNQVTLDDVVVDDANRIGPVGDGWRVAMTTLSHEHVALPLPGASASVWRLVAMARAAGSVKDPVVRNDLVKLFIQRRILDLNAQRTLASMRSGKPPGPEGSIAKLVATNYLTSMGECISELLGPMLMADTGRWGTTAWTSQMLGSIGLRIGGGTDEIQRNMLAERVLGLPRTPR